MFSPYHTILLFVVIITTVFHEVRADISVTDDAGNVITLKQPASRIISLAPNLTELVFSVGAGNHIIATVSHSDYPPAARDIRQIGDSHNVDVEAIVALMPDLVLAWQSGNNSAIFRKLAGLGLTVYQSEADTLEKIGTTLMRLGKLTGTESIAITRVQQFNNEISILEKKYSNKDKVRVFYQFWDRPMYTVNGRHLISSIIELCGGKNIYSELVTLTPQISIEAVLQANPEIIIASGSDDQRPDWLDAWNLWNDLAASRNRQLYFVPPDYIQRHTTRVTRGARMICEFIEKTRTLNR